MNAAPSNAALRNAVTLEIESPDGLSPEAAGFPASAAVVAAAIAATGGKKTGGLLTLKQAAAELPGEGGAGHLHHVTLYRWIVRGQLGIRLQAISMGKQWYTRHVWIEEFLFHLTQRRLGATATGRQETIAQRIVRLRKAESRRRLARHGIK